jgi:hypothetical protein
MLSRFNTIYFHIERFYNYLMHLGNRGWAMFYNVEWKISWLFYKVE